MAFEQRLKAYAQAVEANLTAWFAAKAAGPAPSRLLEAMRHAVFSGGKRFRPFLVLEAASLFGVAPARAMSVAAALECVHCYSLVHDDLPAMDNDDLRRGQPTVHIKFDEATAILAGDALMTAAFEMLAHPAADADASVRAELVLRLADAAGLAGMAGGQMLDLRAGETPQSLDDIQRMQRMKTGVLIRCAVESGAILGRAGDTERRALITYGDAIGRAFQISDDLIDATSTAAAAGKATGKDVAAGKATFISHLGVAGAEQALARLEKSAVASLEPFGASATILAEAARFLTRRRA